MSRDELVQLMLQAYYGDEFQSANAPNMEAALSAALPILREQEIDRWRLVFEDIADSLAFDAWTLKNTRCQAALKMAEHALKQMREHGLDGER